MALKIGGLNAAENITKIEYNKNYEAIERVRITEPIIFKNLIIGLRV